MRLPLYPILVRLGAKGDKASQHPAVGQEPWTRSGQCKHGSRVQARPRRGRCLAPSPVCLSHLHTAEATHGEGRAT